jgi:MFS family permease
MTTSTTNILRIPLSRPLRWYDYITTNIYFLGLTTVAQANGLIFPLLIERYVGEAGKATFFGNLRLWTLMVALLVQSAMGMLSDHSTSSWGRRRPFILAGTVFSLMFMVSIGYSTGMAGMNGYWFLFTTAILLSISSNTSQAAEQGLIPDLVPEEKRGRFSGVKAILELPLPLLLVSFTIANLVSKGNMWAGIIVAMAVLTLSMLVTLFVPERSITTNREPLDWTPFLRLALMTALFTALILGIGWIVRRAGDYVQTFRSIPAMLTVMGALGFLGIITAVAMGVWMSVRLSLGQASAQQPGFTWWVINRLAYLVGAVNLSTFAVFFIQARLGYIHERAAKPAAILMLVVGVFILVAALPSGWLADRFGHKRLVAGSGIVAAFGTLVALSLPSLPVIYIGGCILGAATGVFYTANWALGTDLVPKSEAARYLGISNLAGAGAGAVGAYIGGPIADFFTLHIPQLPGVGYVLLFGIYGSLFLLSVLALSRVEIPKSSSG